MANDVDAARRRLFAGASTGTSYSPTSPLLGAVFNAPEAAPTPRPRRDDSAARQAPVSAPPPAPLELSTLESLPAAELRRMLAVRAVGSPAGATEKADLARWVHQHQDLPVVRPDATQPSASPSTCGRPADGSKSLAQLKDMSVAELRKVLHERGVGEGPAAEKSELVQWVFQHQHLPVLREDDPRRQQYRGGKRRRTFGPGGYEDPYDLPCDGEGPESKKQEQLEGDETKKLEGASQPLLEGGCAEEEASKPSRLWLIPAGLLAAVASAAAFLMINDVRRAAAEADRRQGVVTTAGGVVTSPSSPR